MNEVDPLDFRPKRWVAVSLGGVFGAAACLLVYVGWVLGPNDVEAMDGLRRLLFTVVSIQWFAWAFAAVFALLGARVASVGFRVHPTLRIHPHGLSIGGGVPVPWTDLGEVRTRPKPEVLEIDIGDRTLTWPAFELGADPRRVAELIVARRGRLGRPA